MRNENKKVGRDGISLTHTSETENQGEGIPLMKKEKELELMHALIQEI